MTQIVGKMPQGKLPSEKLPALPDYCIELQMSFPDVIGQLQYVNTQIYLFILTLQKIVNKQLIIAYIRGKSPLRIYYRGKNALRIVSQRSPCPKQHVMSSIQNEGYLFLHQVFVIVDITLQCQIQSDSDRDSHEKVE